MMEFNPMKKYVQLNDLVINDYELESADLSGSTKTETQEYSFGHGSRLIAKDDQQHVTEQDLSMRLDINYRKLSNDQKTHFKDWIKLNILKVGRIWAIEGDQLLWAFMAVTDWGEPYELFRGYMSIDLDIVIYEGVWHKANPRKTFFEPYDTCNFLECLDFQDQEDCDCCLDCIQPVPQPCLKCQCECEFLDESYSLCAMKEEITEDFYSECGPTHRIIYNCEKGDHIWGEQEMWGIQICKEDYCDEAIAGSFYSDTVVKSKATIRLTGKWQDPTIEINNKRIQIMGDYDGMLILYKTGDVYYSKDCCNEPVKVDLELIKILDGYLGLPIRHGTNYVYVTGGCCKMGCIYIDVDSITI